MGLRAASFEQIASSGNLTRESNRRLCGTAMRALNVADGSGAVGSGRRHRCSNGSDSGRWPGVARTGTVLLAGVLASNTSYAVDYMASPGYMIDTVRSPHGRPC